MVLYRKEDPQRPKSKAADWLLSKLDKFKQVLKDNSQWGRTYDKPVAATTMAENVQCWQN